MCAQWTQSRVCSIKQAGKELLFCIAAGWVLCSGQVIGEEPDRSRASQNDGQNTTLESLFNGRDFHGWKHHGNWHIASQEFYCFEVGERHNDLHYVAKQIPGDCELAFQWKESGGVKDTRRLNPGYGIHYNIGGLGRPTSTYGAGIDYHVSGIDVRLHTRSVYDESPIENTFTSGFTTYWPTRDFSRPLGQWNQSCILCKGSRIQFWLNGNCAFDLDLETERVKKGKPGESAIEDLAADGWIRFKDRGLYVSVIAPLRDDFDADHSVQIRSLAVRPLKQME